jgi:dimethyladenosine transferase 1
LSREILRQYNPKRLVLIEKDPRFLPMLQQIQSASSTGTINISISDALNLDSELSLQALTGEEPHNSRTNPSWRPKTIHIIGNLPFGVASIILIKILQTLAGAAISDSPLAQILLSARSVELVLMFQKEVAEVCNL